MAFDKNLPASVVESECKKLEDDNKKGGKGKLLYLEKTRLLHICMQTMHMPDIKARVSVYCSISICLKSPVLISTVSKRLIYNSLTSMIFT